jgi:hypothetical protein
VLTAQGTTVEEVVRSIGVTAVTYYGWREEYGACSEPFVRVRVPRLYGAQATPLHETKGSTRPRR